mgnify:CR=1 FL=1
MKNNAIKKLEGYAVYNKCMPTSIERFFSGSHDTYKEGMPENNKELCEKYIKEHYPSGNIKCVKATLYHEIPENAMFCNKSKECGENVCYCKELIEEPITKPRVEQYQCQSYIENGKAIDCTCRECF